MMILLIIIISAILFLYSILEYLHNGRTGFDQLYRLYEFLFNRWTISVLEKRSETWFKSRNGKKIPNSDFTKDYVLYKKVNKFDNSVKYEKKYLN